MLNLPHLQAAWKNGEHQAGVAPGEKGSFTMSLWLQKTQINLDTAC